MLGKPAFNDIKEGIVTAPLIYGLIDTFKSGNHIKFEDFNRVVMSNFANQQTDVPIGVNLLFESNGIEMADKLSINYID